MFAFSGWEVALGYLLACRRFGLARGTLVGIGLACLSIYMLPPTSCGCFRPILRRCDATLRWFAPVRSDLKNLASQQAIYFSDQGSYSEDPTALAFVHSQGVRVTIEATREGWAAWATHSVLDDGEGCAMYGGTPPAGVVGDLLAGAESGELRCTR
jgi:hypothetical protein